MASSTVQSDAPETVVDPVPAPRPRGPRLRIAAWIGLMLVVPWVIQSDLWIGIGIVALIAAIGALGMQVITGLAGQISLGHAFFLAVGAYTSAWLGVEQGLPFWIWLPASGLAAALVGALVAPTAVRIRGLNLAVATLALVFIGSYLWETWTSVSGGANGRPAAPIMIGDQDLLGGYWVGDREVLTSFQAWWYVAFVVLLIAMLCVHNIRRSRLGRAFMAVRDKDVAAAVVGVPVTRTKLAAFVISSFFAGISGALLVSYMGYFSPSQWNLMLSVDYIAMIIIGGMASVSGAILGAFFVIAMPELVNQLSYVLPFISSDASVSGGISSPLLAGFLYGLIIVLVLLFEPNGLRAMLQRLGNRIARLLSKENR